MAGSSSGAGFSADAVCPAIQQNMIRIAGEASPMLKRQKNGLIDALRSSNNTSGFEQIQVDTGDGKRNEGTSAGKAVQITYIQPLTQAQTASTIVTDCDTAETEQPPCVETVTVDNYVRIEVQKIDEWEFRRFCDSQDDQIAMRVLTWFNAINRQLNQQMGVLLAADVGDFLAGASPQTYTILNADGSSRFNGETELLRDLMDSGLTTRANIVGGGNWFNYIMNRDHGSGGVNNGGTNIGTTGTFNFWYDNQVAGATVLNNANGAFVLEDGASQMLTWNANRGFYAKTADTFQFGTIVDPRTGIMYDMEAHYTKCGENQRKWTIWIGLHYGLWTIPSDAWPAGHELAAVNGTYSVIGAQAP